MVKAAKQRKLILVEWRDSHSGNGWQPLDELEKPAGPIYCRSVGWLVSECTETLVLVSHISGERNGDVRLFASGDITIPREAIVKRTVLRIG